jgi:hypothetical protein
MEVRHIDQHDMGSPIGFKIQASSEAKQRIKKVKPM